MNRNASTLQAGSARVEITPSGAISMGGYGQRAGMVSVGVHDPLYAKALFLTDGEVKLLCITTDLISIPNLVYTRVLKGLLMANLAQEAEILITASHTHSGPDVDESLIIAAPIKEYLDALVENLILVGKKAAARIVPVKIKMGAAKVDFLVNRRQMGRENLVDERVLAIQFSCLDDNAPLAVLFGAGCHPVCLGHDNLLISADYPGYAQRYIERSLGVENALFVNLTEGNVIPATRPLYDSLDTRGYLGGSFEDAEQIGVRLGKAVVHKLRAVEYSPVYCFWVDKRTFSVQPAQAQMSTLSAVKELLRQRRIILEYLPGFSRASVFNLKPVFTLWRDASAEVIARNMSEAEMRRLMSAVSTFLVMAMKLTNLTYRKPLPVGVQTIQLNDYRLMTLPGEALVEVGRDWQSRNHPYEEKAFVIGLANGFMGYLPHPNNFLEHASESKYETIMNALEQDATRLALDQAEQMVRARETFV